MFKIHLKDTVLDLSTPLVMGILNATPDSFFEGSRMEQIDAGVKKALEMAQFGASILDIGVQDQALNSLLNQWRLIVWYL
jgi:dihydropteroate synthase